MNQASEDDIIVIMRLRPIEKREAYLFLIPKASFSLLIVIQEMLQLLAFCMGGVPGKLGTLLIRSWWQLPLALFGISSSPSLQKASTAIGGLLCYLGLVVISLVRARNDIAEVRQWRTNSRLRTANTRQPTQGIPFSISVPSWLSVIDIAYAFVPASRDQNHEQASPTPFAIQKDEQWVVDSTLTFVHPDSEHETQESAAYLLPTQIDVPEIEASTLTVAHPDSASDTLIVPQSDSSSVTGEAAVTISHTKILVEISLLLEIEQDISTYLQANCRLADGEETHVQIDIHLNRVSQALIVLLALEGKKRGIGHKKLKKMTFGDDKSKQIQDAFNQSMSRIRDTLQGALDQAIGQLQNAPQLKSAQLIFLIHGMNMEDSDRQPKLTHKGIVFQQKVGTPGESWWRLTPLWRVKQFDRLEAVYETIKRAQSNPRSLKIDYETLKEMIDQVRREYWGVAFIGGLDEETCIGGFLVNLLDEKAFAEWSPEHYETRRRKFCVVMRYAAQREIDRGEHEPGERDFCLRQAAELNLEYALAASCRPVDDAEGQQSLRECLQSYLDINDLETANRTYRIYAKRMKKVDVGWEPNPEIVKIMLDNDLYEK